MLKIYILKVVPAQQIYFYEIYWFQAIRKGYDVEYFHCSSDSQSGWYYPRFKSYNGGRNCPIQLIGISGVVEEIVNLGEFWNTIALADIRIRF